MKFIRPTVYLGVACILYYYGITIQQWGYWGIMGMLIVLDTASFKKGLDA